MALTQLQLARKDAIDRLHNIVVNGPIEEALTAAGYLLSDDLDDLDFRDSPEQPCGCDLLDDDAFDDLDDDDAYAPSVGTLLEELLCSAPPPSPAHYVPLPPIYFAAFGSSEN